MATKKNTDYPKNTDYQSSDEPTEFKGSPNMGVAVISGSTFTNKAVVYYETDGMCIFEGDIALGTVEEVKAATEKAREAVAADPNIAFSVGITGSRFRWPNCRIPYEIDPNLPNQQRVTDAIAHWEARTAFRFPLRIAANAAQFPNWVRFTDAGGCWSMLGMQGGQQTISLGTGCTTGNTIHEIGHAVGLWHEQSREDRDLFVTINWQNIQAGMSAQFNQHITDGDDLGAYDYGSIMHYPRTAFSRNGQETITPTNPATQIGQRTALSTGDIAGVRTMYPLCGTVIASVPLYRYWNPGIGDHFYTTNFLELGVGNHGWGGEGIQCHAYPKQVPGTVPLYRYWNPRIGDHFYTTNFLELGVGNHGWGGEGIQCYVYPKQVAGTVPLYRYWNPRIGDHFYTTNFLELGFGNHGWGGEGIQCYVLAQQATAPADSPRSAISAALEEEQTWADEAASADNSAGCSTVSAADSLSAIPPTFRMGPTPAPLGTDNPVADEKSFRTSTTEDSAGQVAQASSFTTLNASKSGQSGVIETSGQVNININVSPRKDNGT